MARSTDAQKAERLNAAHRLLARGQSVGEAALSLSRQFAMSRRQAYRYIEEAQLIGRPVPVVEPATAVTFKLPPSLVDAVRAGGGQRNNDQRHGKPRAAGVSWRSRRQWLNGAAMIAASNSSMRLTVFSPSSWCRFTGSWFQNGFAPLVSIRA